MKLAAAVLLFGLALGPGTVAIASPEDGGSTSATEAPLPATTGGLRAVVAMSQSSFRSSGGSIDRTSIGLGLGAGYIGWSRSLGFELQGAALAGMPVPDDRGGIGANHFNATVGFWGRVSGTSVGARAGADLALYYLEEGTYQERTDTRFAPRLSVAAAQRIDKFELNLEAGMTDEPFYSVEIGWRAARGFLLSLAVTRQEADFDEVSGQLTMWGLSARSGL